jgi:hypothetical protein
LNKKEKTPIKGSFFVQRVPKYLPTKLAPQAKRKARISRHFNLSLIALRSQLKHSVFLITPFPGDIKSPYG